MDMRNTPGFRVLGAPVPRCRPRLGRRRPYPAGMLADLLVSPGVHEHVVLAGSVGVMAIHGGLESGTAEAALSVARASGASAYVVTQPDDLRWHVPSIRFDPDQSPNLRAFVDHVGGRAALAPGEAGAVAGPGLRRRSPPAPERPHRRAGRNGRSMTIAARSSIRLAPHAPWIEHPERSAAGVAGFRGR